MNKKIKEGDVFIISDVLIDDDKLSLKKKIRLGKVIFISKITKKTIGIVISNSTYDEIPNDILNIKFLDKVFYTGNHFLKDGNWSIIGNQTVTDAEKELTTRLIGNSLWKLDVNLGVVPNEDRKKYNKQLIYGFEILYSVIDNI